MTHDDATRSPLRRLIEEDAVGQLRRRDGLMATLGSEDGVLKLDWVEGVARLLADPARLEEVEAEARALRARGIRYIIWAGMGGSVLTVRVLCALGFCDGREKPPSSSQGDEGIAMYPLDSTDPAALNAIIRAIAAAKQLALPSVPEAGTVKGEPAQSTFLHTLLHDVLMIGVSMGMTSEEPITHLAWFTELLERAQLRPTEHLLVMTLPGSYLDAFAREHHAPRRPLQLDGGTGTGGRMSAPTTRVFLLPAALALTRLSDSSGQLRSVLQRAWDAYHLDLATARPADHPFVQLAAALSAASSENACRLLISMPEGWRVLVSWLEQLMEESLGKGGKGVVVFDDQTVNAAAPGSRQEGTLWVRVVTDTTQPAGMAQPVHDRLFILPQPSLASAEPQDRLAALAASFLGWQLSMALYGYLHRIPFAGQAAVEHYKARARSLRTQADPLRVAAHGHPALRDGMLTLLAPAEALPAKQEQPSLSHTASVFARAVREAVSAGDTGRPDTSPANGHPRSRPLGYLDLTLNGEAPASVLSVLAEHAHTIGNTLLGVPVKQRRAPAAYHSTEQSEMDGPPYLVSLRLVARTTEACLLGSYTNTFLHAQAASTWQAMMEAGRPCFLLVIDGSLDDAREPLAAFFADVERALRQTLFS